MKKIYIPLIISVFASCLMNAQPTNWFGDLTTTNNSNYTDTSMTDRGVLMATQPLQATVSKPNAKFIFNTAVGVWDPKWTGSNAPDTIRTTNSKLVGMAYFGHDEAWQWDFTTNITSGNYYTFLCGKNAAANNDMSVLETTFLPVIIDSISADASGTILPATAVNVTVCLNADTSAGEKVFLRYTTDGWSTSAFVEVSVYDVNHDGAAVIPGQISGTTVEYYILTTIDDTPDAADIDYLTLRIMNNANANYSYNVLSDKSLTVSADSILHELTLDNRVLYLKLGNETFADATLEDTNFVLLNAPAGVGIDSVTYLSTDSVSLALSFDATDFDADSTHFMVKIKAVELTGTEDLTSNAITIFYENENAGLWCHLLTTDTIEHYLGDVTGHWINMEIGQATWDATHIGYGLSNSDSTGWTWQDATWYADGTPPNKQVHSLVVIPPALGTGSFWYAGRFRDNGAGPWYIANNGNWSNSLLFSPEQYITVSALPIPASCGATAYNGNRIDLSWTANSGLPNVIITARENSDLSANPVQGTTYNVDDSIGGGVVVYRGSGTSFAHTGLNTDATWYYRFYTENNSYYSEYNAMAAASETTDSTGCEFTVNLGGDTSICGSGAVLLNPGIVISPYGDSLTITYDATSGVSGLTGATSVYMHSGAELHTGGGWQYPIGNWGMDDGLGKMTNVGQDLWQITINPVNYYGYNADSILHGIFMVFRNDDGSLTGKNELNDDIWAGMNPVYCGFSGVSLSFDPNEYDQITWSDGSHGNTLTATTSGTYYVTIESVYGCSASDTIEVGLNSLPVVEIGDDTTVCNGDSLVLDAGTGFTTYLWNDASTGTTLTIDSSGIYSVTVTNAAGCSGMDVVFVELLSSPVAGFTTSANGLTIDFTDISTDGETYEWDFNNDGTPESTTAGDVSYTFPGAGQFYVSLEVTNACGTDTYSQLILVNSIHDYSSDASFDVFPNPANDKLNIQVVLPESQDFRLLLQDVNGRTLYFGEEDYRKDAGNYTIDISRFAPGVYILKFESNSRSLITKIIIE